MPAHLPDDNLEKFFQESLEGFGDDPSPGLWGAIDAQIPPPPNNGIIAYLYSWRKWGVAALWLLVLGTAGYACFYYQQQLSELSETIEKQQNILEELQKHTQNSTIHQSILPTETPNDFCEDATENGVKASQEQAALLAVKQQKTAWHTPQTTSVTRQYQLKNPRLTHVSQSHVNEKISQQSYISNNYTPTIETSTNLPKSLPISEDNNFALTHSTTLHANHQTITTKPFTSNYIELHNAKHAQKQDNNFIIGNTSNTLFTTTPPNNPKQVSVPQQILSDINLLPSINRYVDLPKHALDNTTITSILPSYKNITHSPVTKWFIQTELSPNFGHRKIKQQPQPLPPNPPNPPNVPPVGSGEKVAINMHTGLNVGIEINKRWRFSLGLGYQYKKNSLEHPFQVVYNEDASTTETDNSITSNYKYTLDTSYGDAELDFNLSQHHQNDGNDYTNGEKIKLHMKGEHIRKLIRVPALVAFNVLPNKKWNIWCETGISGNFMLSNFVTVKSIRPEQGGRGRLAHTPPPQNTKNPHIQHSRKMGVSGLVQVSAQYMLNSHLALECSPRFEQSFTPILKNNNTTTYPYAGGLSLGLRYYL